MYNYDMRKGKDNLICCHLLYYFPNILFCNAFHPRKTDSIFILKSLLIKYLTKKKSKVYSCFIDLRRAFDTVWHVGLLYKLKKDNVGKKLFEIIMKLLMILICHVNKETCMTKSCMILLCMICKAM
jgi:hypothetical protein